jgi:hypothetical protein
MRWVALNGTVAGSGCPCESISLTVVMLRTEQTPLPDLQAQVERGVLSSERKEEL